MAASIFWSILMKKAQAWSLGDVEVKFYSIVELIVNYNVIFATLFLNLLMLIIIFISGKNIFYSL